MVSSGDSMSFLTAKQLVYVGRRNQYDEKVDNSPY